MELFKLEQLSFHYPAARTPSLDSICMEVQEGEFILLCGNSGCGKTTLLKQFKREITPAGSMKGSIRYRGIPLREIEKEVSAKEIGFVFQNPDNQIVMDDAYSELAFGMENLRYSPPEMKRKIAELCSFFGMASFLDRKISELSGGQKQILNLASVLLLKPRVLLLDEPTSQLDPVAAKEFLLFLKRLNEEFGMTILLSEHRFDDIYPILSRVLYMEKGRILLDAPPEQAAERLWKLAPAFLPTQAVVSKTIGERLEPPGKIYFTVRENQQLVERCLDRLPDWSPPPRQSGLEAEILLEAKRLFFRYAPGDSYVLRDLTLNLQRGKCTCLMGANGSGKSTLLKVLAGIHKPQSGKIKGKEKQLRITYLPQNPLHYFSFEKAEEELAYASSDTEKRNAIVSYLELGECLDSHPHDLSGGEQQRLMIACGVLQGGSLLLMDEPAKGMDQRMKARLGELFHSLKEEGKTLLLVTHDMDFAAQYADNCCLMFQGEAVNECDTRGFFAGNYFYTTNLNRILRGKYPKMTTRKEVECLWQEN